MLRAAHIPNAICLLRVLLVAPIVASLLHGRYAVALSLVFVAGISDGLDGYLAKKYQWCTRLGGLLDPLADKLLIVSLFVTLAVTGLIPAWLAWVVIGRDAIIVTGGIAYNMLVGPLQPQPSRASKLNTLAQLACVVGVLTAQAFALHWQTFITVAGAAVLVTSAVSGLDYVIRWSGKAMQARTPGVASR